MCRQGLRDCTWSWLSPGSSYKGLSALFGVKPNNTTPHFPDLGQNCKGAGRFCSEASLPPRQWISREGLGSWPDLPAEQCSVCLVIKPQSPGGTPGTSWSAISGACQHWLNGSFIEGGLDLDYFRSTSSQGTGSLELSAGWFSATPRGNNEGCDKLQCKKPVNNFYGRTVFGNTE